MNADPFISTIPCDVMFMFTSPIYNTFKMLKIDISTKYKHAHASTFLAI